MVSEDAMALVPHALVVGSLLLVLLLVFRGLHVPRVPRLGEVLCAGGLALLYAAGFKGMLSQLIADPGVRATFGRVMGSIAPPIGFASVSAGIAVLAGAARQSARLQRERGALGRLIARTQDTDRLLQGVMQTSPGGMFMIRLTPPNERTPGVARVQICNEIFEHLVGVHRSRLIGASIATLPDRQLGAWLASLATRAAATSLPVRDERRFGQGDGTTWYDVTMIAHADRIAATITDVTARKNAEVESWRSARTDPLTGLANRTLMTERLQEGLARVRSGATAGLLVLFFDFDGFKQVNDTLGHDAGDRLLMSIGRRLTDATGAATPPKGRPGLVCRLGGDEFVILLPDVRDDTHAHELSEAFLKALRPEHDIPGGPIRSSASIGAVRVPRGVVVTPNEVLRGADEAMYKAKRAGKSRCEFGALRQGPRHPDASAEAAA